MANNLDSIKDLLWSRYVTIANDVISGKYGCGSARKNALAYAGYKPEIVQAIVNKILQKQKQPKFTPRLLYKGVQNSPWWYSSGNKLYAAGYGLPNCTCYAYGRYAEIRGAFASLPTRNAGYWYDLATRFKRGSTPALGSIICYYDPKGKYAGHVAVVEVIHSNGDITTSNSAWQGKHFWTERVTKASGYRANWAKRKGYVVKGFIYNDAITTSTVHTDALDVLKTALWQTYVSTAKNVISGKYGNGNARVMALRGAGYLPDIVQAIVNRLMK